MIIKELGLLGFAVKAVSHVQKCLLSFPWSTAA